MRTETSTCPLPRTSLRSLPIIIRRLASICLPVLQTNAADNRQGNDERKDFIFLAADEARNGEGRHTNDTSFSDPLMRWATCRAVCV